MGKEYWIHKGDSEFADEMNFCCESEQEIKKEPDGFYDLVSPNDTINGGVHVIEYSEYEKVKKALEFYADKSNWYPSEDGFTEIDEDDAEMIYAALDDSIKTSVGGKLARQKLKEINDNIVNTKDNKG